MFPNARHFLYSRNQCPSTWTDQLPKVQAAYDLGPELLAIIIRLVFAILLTSGFAAGLGLRGWHEHREPDRGPTL